MITKAQIKKLTETKTGLAEMLATIDKIQNSVLDKAEAKSKINNLYDPQAQELQNAWNGVFDAQAAIDRILKKEAEQKRRMIDHMLSNWDYIKKLDAIKAVKELYPDAALGVISAAYDEAYEV